MLFSDLKPKQKTFLTEISYQDVLAEYVLGMLEYPNFPVEIEYVRYLDFLLLKEGKAALYKSSYWGRWVIGNVSFEGIDLNEYGMLQDAHVFDRAGHDELLVKLSGVFCVLQQPKPHPGYKHSPLCRSVSED